MKKFISLILAILLAFSAVACSGGGAGDVTTVADDTTEAPKTETEAATDPVPETTEEIQEDKMLNILFLGNSLMYYNDMPDLFAKIATANGKKVSVRSVTKGSATISDFTDERTEVGKQAIPLLKNNSWDYVIIEPSRRISPYENTVKEVELASAKKIQELAKAAGGDVLLYSVWGNNNGTVVEYNALNPTSISEVASHHMTRKPHTKFMHEVNLEFAAALGGGVGLLLARIGISGVAAGCGEDAGLRFAVEREEEDLIGLRLEEGHHGAERGKLACLNVSRRLRTAAGDLDHDSVPIVLGKCGAQAEVALFICDIVNYERRAADVLRNNVSALDFLDELAKNARAGVVVHQIRADDQKIEGLVGGVLGEIGHKSAKVKLAKSPDQLAKR